MDPSPSKRAVTTALVLGLLVVALVPGGDTQSANALCRDPEDDGDVSASSSATERAYDDLVVRIDAQKNVRLTPASGSVETLPMRGVHFLGSGPGTLAFDVVVENVGTGTPTRDVDQVSVRIRVTPPSQPAFTETVHVEVPATGATRSTSVTIPFPETGRHVLALTVNPDRALEEVCEDQNPNPACGFEPCSFDYHWNNTASYGLILGERADLEVSQLIPSGPSRATREASPDSRVVVEALVENLGAVAAFDLSETDPTKGPLRATFKITGCGCEETVSFPWIAPGAMRTIQAELPAHGYVDIFQVEVRLDPERNASESNTDNNVLKEIFPLPTADLAASIVTSLPMIDGRAVLAQGENATFTANVQNLGTARALASDRGPFTVRITREADNHVVRSEQMTLDGLATAPIHVKDTTALPPGDHDYLVQVDAADLVLESSESNNHARLRVTVAEFDPKLKIKESDARSTIPPGVTGQVPFEVENGGTVPDTLRFSSPSSDREAVTFIDASGNELDEVTLKEKETFKGTFRYVIPPGAVEGETYPTALYVRSEGSGKVAERSIVFTIGPDTVPPTITLEDPSSGFLSKNTVTVRVVDNVAVQSVETDLSGTFQPLLPEDEAGSLYRVGVQGLPNTFRLNIRATDEAGNADTRTFELRRDLNPPRITEVTFIPNEGVRPGDKVTVLVTVRDDNMGEVTAEITQGRGGGNVYRENQTFRPHATNWQLRDWVVPERPGHYTFNVTATDQAGNTASTRERLTVPGLDLRAPPSFLRPIVSHPRPVEGDRIQITWQVQNTNPTFSSGEFFAVMVLDDRRQIGRTIQVGPGEVRPVTFDWVATPGPHVFTLVIDQAEEVSEDDERVASNVVQFTTEVLFPDHPLFAPLEEPKETSGWTDLIVRHWYFPVLVVATAFLFTLAVVLGRRMGAP